jgi:adenylate kinase family enzyme
MIINLRGTSGSGKSTIVRALRDKYWTAEKQFESGRKQPICYLCHRDEQHSGRALTILGHYETACGGCDTINGLDKIYGMVSWAAENNRDVIYEGLIVASDVTRAIDTSKKYPPMIVIELSTPLDVCLEGIQARRDARGDDRPLNPKNTESKMKSLRTQRIRFKDAGVDYRYLSREEALKTVLEAMGW